MIHEVIEEFLQALGWLLGAALISYPLFHVALRPGSGPEQDRRKGRSR